MRILTTGSRDYRDLAMIEHALAAHARGRRDITIRIYEESKQ